MKREAPGPEEFKGPFVKFLAAGEAAALAGRVGAGAGDLALFVAADEESTCSALAAVRIAAARKRGLVDGTALRACWIVDFPLLERTADGGWAARHHAFTSPRPQDLDLREKEPGKVLARAYDLVVNGYEIGGGSIRTHRTDVQERVFRAVGIGAGEAREKFTFLLEALASGAPPHGGIALGVDRLVMVILGLENIRDGIAFPKTTSAQDLMTGAPSKVGEAQLRELRIRPEA